ncbi:MAG: hypothetical protein KGD57_09505 [Candidatus Lokiarchaeota archaeon]|nr:hypothetical protein [Candidatus Lokiarchaeota archaeon]
MKENIKDILVRVPHRITGFFEIVNMKNGIKLDNPELIGSKGAGFTLSAYGYTKIRTSPLEKDDESVCKIYINKERVDDKAGTSYFIFSYIKDLIIKQKSIEIYHDFDLPVECGYGASGSGALGAIFGLNKVLNLNLSSINCGRIAHISEVINKTGLGTVCGQLNSGLTLLKRAGYPCNCERIPIPKDLNIITTSFGNISTKSILSDEKVRSRIMNIGKIIYQKFIKNPCIETFMKLSLEFIEKTNILDILELSKIKELISQLNKEKIIGASMNQLGRSVYAICRNKDVKNVIEKFNTYQTIDKIFNLQIDEKGLRILK